jgi:60 kDa SS-A/Ro ribonucleoprotein
MSKFNSKALASATQEYQDLYGKPGVPSANPYHTTKETKNHEDGMAFHQSKEMALYSLVCTMGLGSKFYESEDEQMNRLIELIKTNDPLFVAKLAVYAREKMYLRSIPLVITVELAKIHRGSDLISRLTQRVIQRADEITEILAYYQASNGRLGETKKLGKLSNQIKKGIRMVFESGKFNEYQFAKHS